jgi:hypothetical protein
MYMIDVTQQALTLDDIKKQPLAYTCTHPEFRGQIADILEDFLTEKGATIKNPERDALLQTKEPDAKDAAIIFGKDYDALSAKINDCIYKLGFDKEYTMTQAADRIMFGYAHILSKAEFPEGVSVTEEDTKTLRSKLLDLLQQWKAGK